MTDLSRRNWLKAAAGTTLLAGTSLATAKGVDPMPEKWDETFDVVVIGSGFAGLAAAIEARLAGSTVCVLEKMRTIGGNSIINGGIMAVGEDIDMVCGNIVLAHEVEDDIAA